jgi:hypothetical protein
MISSISLSIRKYRALSFPFLKIPFKMYQMYIFNYIAKGIRRNSSSLRPTLPLQILQINRIMHEIILEFFPLQPKLEYFYPQGLPQLGYNNERVHSNAAIDQTALKSIYDDDILIYHSREVIFSVNYIEFSNEFKKQQ